MPNNLPSIKQTTSLPKIENKLAITNKLIDEVNVIAEYHWEWWHNLSNIWKKALNGAIGKFGPKSDIVYYDVYNEDGVDDPNEEELISILQLKVIKHEPAHDEFVYDYNFRSYYSEGRESEIDWIEDKLKKDGYYSFDLRPLIELKNLEEFSCTYYELRDLKPLESLPQLKKLTLMNNNISNLEPIGSLKNLSYLSLSGKIKDFTPIIGLKKLVHLDC